MRAPVHRVLALLALCFILASCASVPLSTLMRMSSFSEEKFAGLRPDDIGIKVRLPEGFALDVAHSRLAIEVASNAGTHTAAFDLEQTGLQSRAGGEYELQLTAEARDRFRQLQAFVAKAQVEDIAIRVMPKLASKPERASSVAVWIDLRLAQEDGYFALVDGASISLAK